MTKKDYVLIANAIDELFLKHQDWQRNLSQVASKLADKLAEDNPRFDRNRFLKACGVDEA